MKKSTLTWHTPARSLPDDDTEVLAALETGEVTTAFLEAGQWYYASPLAERFFPLPHQVTHWANLPDHPAP